MIRVKEHFHFRADKGILTPSESESLSQFRYIRKPSHTKDEQSCLPYYEIYKNDDASYVCETHYYIGLDWINAEKIISVEPKIDGVDYLQMLFEALEDPENLSHLTGLCEIDFHQPKINVPKVSDDLSIFLVIEYLQVLRHLVRKGLKKEYYRESKVFNGRIKGKIEVNKSIRQQIKTKMNTHISCNYQVFGVDHPENRLLKKAYRFSEVVLARYPSEDFKALRQIMNYIRPAFKAVSDEVSVEEIKAVKPNPFYQSYSVALSLAQALLQRFSYQPSMCGTTEIKTPPYWINMAKLFELYIFAKLRETFPLPGAVKYHVKKHRQEIDFLLDVEDKKKGLRIQKVIDAKYKPQYFNRGIGMDDARQVAGYTRLESVYKTLKIEMDDARRYPIIDALIIYPNKESCLGINLQNLETFTHYVNIEKLGISLPIKNEKVREKKL